MSASTKTSLTQCTGSPIRKVLSIPRRRQKDNSTPTEGRTEGTRRCPVKVHEALRHQKEGNKRGITEHGINIDVFCVQLRANSICCSIFVFLTWATSSLASPRVLVHGLSVALRRLVYRDKNVGISLRMREFERRREGERERERACQMMKWNPHHDVHRLLFALHQIMPPVFSFLPVPDHLYDDNNQER